MLLSIDNLPITLSNDRQLKNTYRLLSMLAIGLFAFFTVAVAFEFNKFHRVNLILSLALGLLLIVEGAILFAQFSRMGVVRLTIDAPGVRLMRDRTEILYRWPEIQEVRKTSESHSVRNKVVTTYFLEIRRKGELVHGQKAWRIPEGMGIGVDELKSLIEAGCKRWSDAPA